MNFKVFSIFAFICCFIAVGICRTISKSDVYKQHGKFCIFYFEINLIFECFSNFIVLFGVWIKLLQKVMKMSSLDLLVTYLTRLGPVLRIVFSKAIAVDGATIIKFAGAVNGKVSHIFHYWLNRIKNWSNIIICRLLYCLFYLFIFEKQIKMKAKEWNWWGSTFWPLKSEIMFFLYFTRQASDSLSFRKSKQTMSEVQIYLLNIWLLIILSKHPNSLSKMAVSIHLLGLNCKN